MKHIQLVSGPADCTVLEFADDEDLPAEVYLEQAFASAPYYRRPDGITRVAINVVPRAHVYRPISPHSLIYSWQGIEEP